MDKVLITLGTDDYTMFKYPGELQVRLSEEGARRVSAADEVMLLARISKAEQLIELCLLADAIREIIARSAKFVVALQYLPFREQIADSFMVIALDWEYLPE